MPLLAALGVPFGTIRSVTAEIQLDINDRHVLVRSLEAAHCYDGSHSAACGVAVDSHSVLISLSSVHTRQLVSTLI
jgi:hypothetical protein